MKRVFLYVRVSTEEQAIHGLSIEAQTAALKEWAKANGYQVMGVYTDAGISARKPASKRPELQRLLNDVRAGKGDLVVFTKLDRWFRNIAEYYKVQEVLEKHHVDWRTIHEDYDTSTSSGRLKINIMLSVAQDEADRTSERIKAVFDSKRAKGEALSGKAPIGYKVENKKLVKDPETQDMVEQMLQKFMSCGSMSETQKFVLDTYGVRINYQLLDKALRNKTYCGTAYGVSGMSPPYLTVQQFEKIQSMRKRVVRKTMNDRIYLFSSLIVCGECGLRMVSGTNKSSPTSFYKCRGHATERNGCGNRVCMNEKKLETYLLDRVDLKFQQYKIEAAKIEVETAGRNYKREISAVRAKIAKLKELYLNDLISLEEYKADHASFSDRLEELLAKEHPAPKTDLELIERTLRGGWKADYETVGRADKRDFWHILLKEIRIYPNRQIEFDLNV